MKTIKVGVSWVIDVNIVVLSLKPKFLQLPMMTLSKKPFHDTLLFVRCKHVEFAGPMYIGHSKFRSHVCQSTRESFLTNVKRPSAGKISMLTSSGESFKNDGSGIDQKFGRLVHYGGSDFNYQSWPRNLKGCVFPCWIGVRCQNELSCCLSLGSGHFQQGLHSRVLPTYYSRKGHNFAICLSLKSECVCEVGRTLVCFCCVDCSMVNFCYFWGAELLKRWTVETARMSFFRVVFFRLCDLSQVLQTQSCLCWKNRYSS